MTNGVGDSQTVTDNGLASQGTALPLDSPSGYALSQERPAVFTAPCVPVIAGQAGKSKKKLKKEKLRAAAQLENGSAAADSGMQGDDIATAGSDQQTGKHTKKNKKKQRQQDEVGITADATVPDAGNAAAPAAEADQSAADRKAAKKQRRAEAKAAARAQTAALTGATAVAAPATDGNVGLDAAAAEAPPAKKAKVAKKTAVAAAAMAAVGSRELAILGA